MTREELLGLVRDRLGDVVITSNSDEWKTNCPFCGGSSLALNVAKRVFHCWKCEESGTLRRLLGRRIPAVEQARKPRRTQHGYVPPGELVPLSLLGRESEAWLYLLGRGFDPLRVERLFDVKYCQAGAKFGGGVFDTTGTVVIPVKHNGADMAWQCRLLYDPATVEEASIPYMGWKYDDDRKKFIKPPKYFTMPGFDKGQTFFNYDQARTFGFVVVTEGAFDAMSVGRCAVAAFGKGLTDVQVSLLREWPVVVLLLDPDASAEQDKLVLRLLGRTSSRGGFCKTPGSSVKVVQVRLDGYKDAGECPHDELVAQILGSAEAQGVGLLDLCEEDPFESGKSQETST